MTQWTSASLEINGLLVRALLKTLCCIFEKGTGFPASYWFNTGNVPLCLNVMTGS